MRQTDKQTNGLNLQLLLLTSMLTSVSAVAENTDFIQFEAPLKYELNLTDNETTQRYGCDSIQASYNQGSTTTDKANSERQYSPESCPRPPTRPPTPQPPKYLTSGYKKSPDTSFTTQATRTVSYCVRYDGQNPKAYPEQPLPITSTQIHSKDTSLFNKISAVVPHQVTSTAEFLAKETQFIAPERASGSRCVEWRQRQISSTSGYVSVRYGKDKRLNKPIVFVQGYGSDFNEGFTMNQVANEKDQFDDFIEYSKQLNTYRHIYNAGYDLVLFRYAKQDSGIESNAWALATLLEKLAKTSAEVRVVGHSMGGIVGKLAIMYMENTGKVHNVSDFVAIDAPFYGVHVPKDVRSFADELENQARKIRCKLYRHSSRRSQCRYERRRLKSINDIFYSYTFKQLDEGSPQNIALRQRFKDLAIFFNPTRSTAVSYGTEVSKPIPQVYFGAGSRHNLKVDVKWRLSGNRRSRLNTTAKEGRNGSYAMTYFDISKQLIAAKNMSYHIKKAIKQDNKMQGRHVFVTTDSAFAGKDGSFDKYTFAENRFSGGHQEHKYVLLSDTLTNVLKL